MAPGISYSTSHFTDNIYCIAFPQNAMEMLVFCIFATILHHPIWFIFCFVLFSLDGLFH